MTRILNQSTIHQRLWISVIWGLTSLLVATLLKLMLKPSAFSDSCKSYPFLCNTFKKCMAVEMQTLGPNLLIFSFSSSVLSAPNVGRWFILSRQIFLTEELYKHDVWRIIQGLFWMLCSRDTRFLALCSLLRLSGSYLRC